MLSFASIFPSVVTHLGATLRGAVGALRRYRIDYVCTSDSMNETYYTSDIISRPSEVKHGCRFEALGDQRVDR
jgi:hypothetical protein